MASIINYEDYLASICYDPSHARAYGGVEKLYRAVRIDGKFVLGRSKIRNWLLKQEDYAAHRETRSKFKRRRVVAPFVDYRWDMDTANMVFYEKYNDDYSYFVLAIDILSKFVWTVPLCTNTRQEMVEALRQMFATGRKPSHIRSDQGPEFLNKNVKTFLKTENVTFFVTHKVVKASSAKRAIKTIKSRLIRYLTRKQTRRWIDVLPQITDSYNKTYRRSIKRTPNSIKPKDSVELWKLQYESPPKSTNSKTTSPLNSVSKKHKIRGKNIYKYKVGDLVRVSFIRKTFQREYDERWSRELFVVNDRFISDGISQYRLKDYAGEVVSGTFYQNRLKKAYEQATYFVEKVLRTRTRTRAGQKQKLLRWKGWPSKFDSWVNAEDIDDLKGAVIN